MVIIVEVRDILGNLKLILNKNNKLLFRNKLYKSESIIINKANAIIALSKGISDYYSKFRENLNITIIRNGFDEKKLLECSYEFGVNKRKTLRISHIGSIYARRNLRDFISALIMFGTERDTKIIFDIVGILDGEAQAEIEGIDLKKTNIIINQIGAVPHEEAIKFLKSCDISVILTHKNGNSDYAIPGKTFEYIGACKPIIAVTEDRELISLVDGKYGECSGHNQTEIYSKLLKLTTTNYDFSDRLQFSRTNQAMEIINYINKNYSNQQEIRLLRLRKTQI